MFAFRGRHGSCHHVVVCLAAIEECCLLGTIFGYPDMELLEAGLTIGGWVHIALGQPVFISSSHLTTTAHHQRKSPDLRCHQYTISADFRIFKLLQAREHTRSRKLQFAQSRTMPANKTKSQEDDQPGMSPA